MIQKTKNCLYCGEKMESITTKKKFCSDKCKMAYSRSQKVGKSAIIPLLKNSPKFPYYTPTNPPFLDKYGQPTDKAAGEPVTVHLTQKDHFDGLFQKAKERVTDNFEWEKQQAGSPYFDAVKLQKRLDALKWVKEVEEYCQNAGILPSDLIDAHRSQNMPKIAKKQGKDVKIQEKQTQSDWRKKYAAQKTGYNPK